MQQKLFNVKPLVPLEDQKKIIEISKGMPEIAYQMFHEKGLPKKWIIWKIVEARFEKDTNKIWDGFENNGRMVYVPEFTLFGKGIYVMESHYDGGAVYFNNNIIFTWSQTDTFSEGTMNKIKQSIRNHIYNNANQIVK